MILMMGLGFVGLTTALGFCEKGMTVYGYDPDGSRRQTLLSGKLPFAEPGLKEALLRHFHHNFHIVDDIGDAIQKCKYVFFAVGTPCKEDGQADLCYLGQAVRQVLDHQRDGQFRVLTIKSTVPPTTTKNWLTPLVKERGFMPGTDVGVANNPEFLREGHCWEDFMHPDRIVIGCDDETSRDMLADLYRVFGAPVCCVSPNTGEFIKYLSNSLLASLISVSNEMSVMADAIGDINVPDAFSILHQDRRWNGCDMTGYVYPGCGYGGYCLPKDTKALRALSQSKGFKPMVLDSVITTNESMPTYLTKKVAQTVDKGKTIGILGLSFKPDSDDVRDSAAAKVIYELLHLGYRQIVAYDPVSNEKFQKQYPFPIFYLDNLEGIMETADAAIVATAWKEFRNLSTAYPNKQVIDLRHMR